MPKTSAKPRIVCQSCRLRHLKCDNQKPACAPCTKRGTSCVRSYNIRFNHGFNPSVGTGDCDFSPDQPWCKTPRRKLSFIDETRELLSIYDKEFDPDNFVPTPLNDPVSDGSDSPPPKPRGPASPSLPSQPAETPATENLHHSPLDKSHPSPADVSQARSSQAPSSRAPSFQPVSSSSPYCASEIPSERFLDAALSAEPLGSISPAPTRDFIGPSPNPISQIYLDYPNWPLKDRNEACLMRYFLDNLAFAFDLCDSDRHFALVVPQRAAVCPTLLNAVFAAAAQHKSRTSDYDPLVADRYHHECLKYLIPVLNDSAAIMDENLLAAVIILRFLEEVDPQLSAEAIHSHRLGSHAFISAQGRSNVFGGLRQAAFWVGLRQEIYMAVIHQRSVQIDLEQCIADRSFDPTDDAGWANRIIVHCAEAVQYCFGGEDADVHKYQQLRDYAEKWTELRPESFTPIYHREPAEGEMFPEIWLANDAVIMGLLHYYLARLLLTAHNPRMPRLGPAQRAALKMMDEEIKQEVRIICGIAKSINRMHPAYVNACMAITVAGDRFTERSEQEELLSFLEKTESYAWPTPQAQKVLKESWGWES